MSSKPEGLRWQVGVWDQLSRLYVTEIDVRFGPVVAGVIARASLRPGDRVLDVGTGTGAVAMQAAARVGPTGRVLGIDISAEMLALASAAAGTLRLDQLTFSEGRAEAMPVDARSMDVVLASLSLMYVIDRAAAAREIARVLEPGGRLIAAVWAGPATCDIVRFQQTAGSFAPPPPVEGVGPGALADPRAFVAQLGDAGIEAEVQTEVTEFEFQDFDSAWHVLAGVTAAQLLPERREEARAAVRALMWPGGDGPRRFRNATHFIVGRASTD